MRTLILEAGGWYGFGKLRTSLFPGFCFGFMRVSWVRGALGDAIKRAVIASTGQNV